MAMMNLLFRLRECIAAKALAQVLIVVTATHETFNVLCNKLSMCYVTIH